MIMFRVRGNRVDLVIPLTVPAVSGDAGLLQVLHLPVTDLDALGVDAGVQLCLDSQPGGRGGRSDGVDDDLMAGQRPAAPVHRDEAEQLVLDLMRISALD